MFAENVFLHIIPEQTHSTLSMINIFNCECVGNTITRHVVIHKAVLIGAIQVLRNTFSWNLDTHPLVTLITLNLTPL